MSDIAKNMLIRPALAGDAPEISAIAQAAFGHYLKRMSKPPQPLLEDYAALVNKGNVFIMHYNNLPAGYIVLIPEKDAMLLDNLGVNPEFQKIGLGKKLLEFAEKKTHEAGLDKIILYTNEAMTENLAWYPKHGYSLDRHTEEKGYRRVYFSKIIAKQ